MREQIEDKSEDQCEDEDRGMRMRDQSEDQSDGAE